MRKLAVIPAMALLVLAIPLARLNGSSAAAASPLIGNWTGILGGASDADKLHLVVHIKEGKDGGLTGTIDSPDQKSFGIPIRSIIYQDSAISFTCPAVKGRYSGKMNKAHSEIIGTWTQPPDPDQSLNLTRAR